MLRAARLGPLLIATLVLAAACSPSRPPPLHPETPAGRWYVVEAGETLAGIAARAGVPAEDILEVNGLDRANQIQAGKLIFVLDAERSPPPPSMAMLGTATAGDGGDPPRLRWPLGPDRIVVASPFGAREGRPHDGIDLPAPTGTPVYAAADGQVIYAGGAIRGYGNMLVLRHTGDLLSVYAHNSALLVGEGQAVRAGDRVALVGQSGHATGPHLHFEVRRGQIPQDPLLFLPTATPARSHP